MISPMRWCLRAYCLFRAVEAGAELGAISSDGKAALVVPSASGVARHDHRRQLIRKEVNENDHDVVDDSDTAAAGGPAPSSLARTPNAGSGETPTDDGDAETGFAASAQAGSLPPAGISPAKRTQEAGAASSSPKAEGGGASPDDTQEDESSADTATTATEPPETPAVNDDTLQPPGMLLSTHEAPSQVLKAEDLQQPSAASAPASQMPEQDHDTDPETEMGSQASERHEQPTQHQQVTESWGFGRQRGDASGLPSVDHDKDSETEISIQDASSTKESDHDNAQLQQFHSRTE